MLGHGRRHLPVGVAGVGGDRHGHERLELPAGLAVVAGLSRRAAVRDGARPAEDDAVGDPAGQGQRLRATHAGEHGWDRVGYVRQAHLVERHLAALEGDRLAAEQPPDGGDDLVQRGER